MLIIIRSYKVKLISTVKFINRPIERGREGGKEGERYGEKSHI